MNDQVIKLRIKVFVFFTIIACSCVKDDLSKISDTALINQINQSFSIPLGSYTVTIYPPQLSDTSNISGQYGFYYFNNNKFSNTSAFFVLPLELFYFNLSDTFSSEKITSIELSIVINNEYPTQLASQISLVDSNMSIIDQLYSPEWLMVNSSSISINQIPLTNLQLTEAEHTKYLLYQGIVQTTDTVNNQPVYFYSKNFVTITLGVKINIQYNIKDL